HGYRSARLRSCGSECGISPEKDPRACDWAQGLQKNRPRGASARELQATRRQAPRSLPPPRGGRNEWRSRLPPYAGREMRRDRHAGRGEAPPPEPPVGGNDPRAASLVLGSARAWNLRKEKASEGLSVGH